jgi:hypothetical protein
LALAGMAAVVLIFGVFVARRGSGTEPAGTADSVPVLTAAPLPEWLPADMDVWNVRSYEERQTSIVALAETGTDRTVEILISDDERAAELALTGADPSGARVEPMLPGTSAITWGENDRTFQAIGRGLEPVELAAVVDQVSVRPDGVGYTGDSLPHGWTLFETRIEPPAVSTTALFAPGEPGAMTPALRVTQTVAEGDGDGAGWANVSAFIEPEADGSIWTLPGDMDDTSAVMMVDRRGQAVTVTSFGPGRYSTEQLRDLLADIIEAPAGQLTDLKPRAQANVARTPVVASATTTDGETIEVHASAAGGAAAICANTGDTAVCSPGTFGIADMITVTVDHDGKPVIFGATRAEPSFIGSDLRSPAWVVQSDGWYLFRVEPQAVSIFLTAGGHGMQTAFTAEVP